MSTSTIPIREPEAPISDHRQNMDLMRATNSPYYNPIQPLQHHWQQHRGLGLGVLIGLWSWLADSTIAYGHRTPYASDPNGEERHIEDFARFWGTDVANARAAWRVGEEIKIWRKGSEDEGRRRLYFEGDMEASRTAIWAYVQKNGGGQEGEEKPNKGVHTPFLERQINKLQAETKASLLKTLNELDTLERRLRADALEAVRTLIEQRQDIAYRDAGVKKIRFERHEKDQERQKARNERVKALVPVIERFAQTYFDFGGPEVCANPVNWSVHTSVSLFTSEAKTEGKSVSNDTVHQTDRPTNITGHITIRNVRDLLVQMLTGKTGETPKYQLCRRILTELKGAPLENLERRIVVRYEAITSMGMCLHLAQDCGAAWVELQNTPDKQKKRHQEVLENQWRDMVAEVRLRWDTLSAEDRQWYHEQHPEEFPGA